MTAINERSSDNATVNPGWDTARLAIPPVYNRHLAGVVTRSQGCLPFLFCFSRFPCLSRGYVVVVGEALLRFLPVNTLQMKKPASFHADLPTQRRTHDTGKGYFGDLN